MFVAQLCGRGMHITPHLLFSEKTLTGTDVRYIESITLPARLLFFLFLLYLRQQFVRNDHLCGLARDAARRHIDRPIMRI